MLCNRVGVRIFIFCVTFLFGFSISDWFNSNANKIVPNEIEQTDVQQPIISFNSKKIEHNPTEPQCKKYFDKGNYIELIQERAEAIALLRKNIDVPQKRNIYREQIKELENKIKVLSKTKEGLKIPQRESNAVHNLLYIENCAEY